MTNLDRIKQMNAEELIAFLGADSICQAIRWHDPNHCRRWEQSGDCDSCIENFLKKDVNYDDL